MFWFKYLLLHKRLTKYNKVNGIIPMTIHVQIEHLKLFVSKKQQLSEVAKLVIVHVQQPWKKSAQHKKCPYNYAITSFLVP